VSRQFGRLAPAFIVEHPDGTQVSFRSFAGRALLINVFAAWCASCRLEEPILIQAYARYKNRVAFLGIDEQEGVARAVAFARELHVPYPIAIDQGQFSASYQTSQIPQTVLIDARGYIRLIVRGSIDAAQLDRGLARIAKE